MAKPSRKQASFELQVTQSRPPKFVHDERCDKLIPDPAVGETEMFLQMFRATGIEDGNTQKILSQQVALTAKPGDLPSDTMFNVCLALLHDIAPRNATEGMLAAQMIGVHNLAMKMLGNAAGKGRSVEDIDHNINRASKLLRIFTAQAEAMQKLQGKTGKQKMVVEHVHINDGGKAIIGKVEHGVGGEGTNGK